MQGTRDAIPYRNDVLTFSRITPILVTNGLISVSRQLSHFFQSKRRRMKEVLPQRYRGYIQRGIFLMFPSNALCCRALCKQEQLMWKWPPFKKKKSIFKKLHSFFCHLGSANDLGKKQDGGEWLPLVISCEVTKELFQQIIIESTFCEYYFI